MISNMIFCLLLLIGVLGQSLAQTDSSTGQSINQPIINRISGCTDVGNITTDCPRVHQSILTIYGSGFMPIDASIKDYSMLLIQSSSRLSYRLTSINDTCITVAYQLYYGQFMNADPITVTIIYQSNEYVSADGLSYEPVQPLSLSRIDGCGVVSPDGLSASGCNYLNPIILIGSGFNTIAADSYRIAFGSSIMSFVANDGMVVLNDSAISLQLSSISMLLPLEAYTSSVPLQISAYSWNLTTFYIRYSSIPASQVTQISPLNNQGCEASQVDGKTRLSGCYAGRSIVRFSGNYIWADTQIFINGVLATPAATTRYSHNVLDVYVSILDTSADMYYDVQLVNAVSQISFPGLMNFVSTPEIAGTTACVKKQNVLGGSPSWKAFCLEGEVFRFTAVNLGGLDTPRVWFGPYECPGVRVHDDLKTISCIVPADPDGTASVEQGLYLNYVDHNSSQVSFQLWDNPYAPRINSLVGTDCYQSSNESKPMQCLFNPLLPGRNLSIVTSRLPALRPSQVWTVNMYFKQGTMMGAARFTNLHIDNPSQIITASQPIAVVWLDGNFRGALTDEAVYQVTLAANDLSDDDGSNILPLMLVSQITYDPVETSHSDDTWKVVVGVMLPLIFVSIVLGAYLYRRRQASKGGDIMSNNYVDSSSSRQMEMA